MLKKTALCSSHIGMFSLFQVFIVEAPSNTTYSNKSGRLCVMGPLWAILMHSDYTFALIAQQHSYNSQSIFIITHSHQKLHKASTHSLHPISPQHYFKGCPQRTLRSHSGYTSNHKEAGKHENVSSMSAQSAQLNRYYETEGQTWELCEVGGVEN